MVEDPVGTIKTAVNGTEDILKFAESLDVLSDEDRETLVNMTPASYIGKASALAKMKSFD